MATTTTMTALLHQQLLQRQVVMLLQLQLQLAQVIAAVLHLPYCTYDFAFATVN